MQLDEKIPAMLVLKDQILDVHQFQNRNQNFVTKGPHSLKIITITLLILSARTEQNLLMIRTDSKFAKEHSTRLRYTQLNSKLKRFKMQAEPVCAKS